MRVGLVLGAGGLTGQAYEAGVLAALDWDLGWDPRSAEAIVGTSAGSLTGAALRLGIGAPELAGWARGRSVPAHPVLEGLDSVRSELPALEARLLLRRWSPPTGSFWWRAVTRPWTLRPLAVLATVLPTGSAAVAELSARHLQDLADRPIPEGLSICALRRDDGRLAVFDGADRPDVDLPTAVAASCAVPGYLSPVTVDGVVHVDGGLHSPTNADVLVGRDLDLVIVVSPMSGRSVGFDAGIRAVAGGRLHAERRALEAAGTEVVVFEPHRRAVRAMGVNPMAEARTASVVRAAFFEAGEQLAQPAVRRALAGLGSRAMFPAAGASAA